MAPIVIKFVYKGPESYRYYWNNSEILTWNKMTDGLRVLFGISDENLALVYKDNDGENVMVTNQFDLTHMLTTNLEHKFIKVLVLKGTIEELLKVSSSLGNDDTVDIDRKSSDSADSKNVSPSPSLYSSKSKVKAQRFPMPKFEDLDVLQK
ncbi:hypothetical protein BB559_004927 [Furculomyces boomerangus]|uniref:PB1 domain-containing protein n=1 Tax=Furculomyces boomerangus TaxID=61424 RepID=A0A2T9Y675_9FUNG|nr:hypothetical protein BB559_005870 [Furculomyces boomerangus]PVU89813.1 hypothetical protein BB559_004927 [Furculomyces boomerangus]